MKKLFAACLVGILSWFATPTPAQAKPKHQDSALVQEIKAEIRRLWGPHGQAGRALAIAHCESHFTPSAKHHNRDGTTDGGVFQLNSGGTAQALGLTLNERFDWRKNVHAAYRLWKQRGWRPWSACGG